MASPGTPRIRNRIAQPPRETWKLCVEKMRTGDYDLLVFDELVYVLSYEFLPRGRSAGRIPRDSGLATGFAHCCHRP